uniref:Uncharacterized protein n=1 Tax=uncultured bacterium BLR10 TaxID=506513 RepID=C0INT7_9BACT|nr:hypothetical protein AKSOIL_0194 [uncultured bacterium BLR10]
MILSHDHFALCRRLFCVPFKTPWILILGQTAISR